MAVGEVTSRESVQLPRDVESQSDRVGHSWSIVGSLIGLEDSLAVFVRYGHPAVADQYFDVAVTAEHFQPNPFTTVANGVRDEVTDDLTDPIRVGCGTHRVADQLDVGNLFRPE